MAFLTSLVDSKVSFLFLLTSPIDFISSAILLMVKSAMLPNRLKKLYSLHSRPVLSQICLTRNSGIMLLVLDDSTRMEWMSRSNQTSSLPAYSKLGASPASGMTCSSSSSQFQSIQWLNQIISDQQLTIIRLLLFVQLYLQILLFLDIKQMTQYILRVAVYKLNIVMMNKAMGGATQPSRQQIFSWIHSLLNDIPLSLKVEQLGKGTIYCRILNHYFPGAILINRIISAPKSEYQNLINLRILQNAFLQLKINILFDPVKLSKEKLNDNWTFIVALYKHLNDECHPTQQPRISNSFYSTYAATPKRGIENLYPDLGVVRQPLQSFYPVVDNIFQQKAGFNGSKYSVGKLGKESALQGNNSPNKGKWSVNSHMFQSNLVPIIDRVKEILLKSSHDTQKIRQVKMLLNIPLNEQVAVKVQEDENNQIIAVQPPLPKQQ